MANLHFSRIPAFVSVALATVAPAVLAQPATPIDLTATVLNANNVVLYWHDKSTIEYGFQIWRKEGGGEWQLIKKTAANNQRFNNNAFVDSGVDTNARTYTYKVRAYTSLLSGFSNEAIAVGVGAASGFDYPVGDVDGLGGYTSYTDGKWCASGWYVFRDVADPLYLVHTGEDWNGRCFGDTDRNQPVYAAAEGKVVYAGYVPSSWGNVVLIAHKLPGGEIVYSQYAHLESTPLVRAGDSVSRRQEIGAIGKGAGKIYPAHLHFEVRKHAVPVGHWPKDSNLIAARYFNPTLRDNNRSNIGGFANTSFIDQNRNLWSAPNPILRIDGGLWSSKAQGQTFNFSGSGYTPGGAVRRFYRNGAGNLVELTPTLFADGSGNIGWPFPPSCSTPVDTYTLYAVDGSSGRVSDEVTEVVTAGAGCVTRYEAENATLTAPAKFNNDHLDYSGSGFVDGYGWFNGSPSIGAATTFSVWVPTSGNYLVELRYANAMGSAKTLSLYANNGFVRQTLLVNLANWDIWSSQAETVYLWAGWNTISYRYDWNDTGNVNLDYIQVSLP